MAGQWKHIPGIQNEKIFVEELPKSKRLRPASPTMRATGKVVRYANYVISFASDGDLDFLRSRGISKHLLKTGL